MDIEFPQIDSPPQLQAEVIVNEFGITMQHVAVYGYKPSTSSGLIWGYYGGRWGGFAITTGTVSLTTATTNYIVVALATGVLSVSTSATNWNNTSNYGRVYKILAGATTVDLDDVEDHRSGPSGVYGAVGTGVGGASASGLEYTASTTTTDSDPGTGIMRWNNATQASATFLYIDNADGDSTSQAILWASLPNGSFIRITEATDADVWQLWKMTAAGVNGTGYYKFAVSLIAQEGGNIPNATALLLDIDAAALGDASTNTATAVDSEVALFSGTGGKMLKRASATGFAILASGVLSAVDGSNDDFPQRKSGAYTNRTVAQVTTDLQSTGLVADSVGFRQIPQNSKSAAYTTVAADSGKHIFHPAADTTARTWTIDSNANVAYPIGTAITFINQNSGGTISIAITSDTMRLAGSGATGTRTLVANGVATAIKIGTTDWIISGTGLS